MTGVDHGEDAPKRRVKLEWRPGGCPTHVRAKARLVLAGDFASMADGDRQYARGRGVARAFGDALACRLHAQ